MWRNSEQIIVSRLLSHIFEVLKVLQLTRHLTLWTLDRNVYY